MTSTLRVSALVVGLSLVGCTRGNLDALGPDAGGEPGIGGNGSGDMAGGATGGDGGPVAGPLLSFAVFGDCRPPLPEDTTRYPTMIVSSIFAHAEDAGAQFVIGTGDYMNAFTQTAVDAQVNLFLGARAAFK